MSAIFDGAAGGPKVLRPADEEKRGVRPPSLGAVLIGLVPFVALCFSVSLWDRVTPFLLGLPFNVFWLIAWILITPLCLWAAYRFEKRGLESFRRRNAGGTP